MPDRDMPDKKGEPTTPEPTAPGTGTPGAGTPGTGTPGAGAPPPIVRWNQRHAAKGERAEQADSAAPAPSPIANWSRRHAAAARVDRARRNGTSGPTPARADTVTDSVPLQPRASASARVTPTASAHRPGPPVGRSALAALSRLLVLVGWLLALLLMLDALFVALSANPANPWAAAVEAWAPHLNLGLGNLALTASPSANMWINHGIAAAVWVAAGVILGHTIVGRLILGRLVRGRPARRVS